MSTDYRDLPLERSDDKGRVLMPHIRSAINQLRGMDTHTTMCAKCRQRRATYLVDTRSAIPKALCDTCARAWRGLSPLQRVEARRTW